MTAVSGASRSSNCDAQQIGWPLRTAKVVFGAFGLPPDFGQTICGAIMPRPRREDRVPDAEVDFRQTGKHR